MEKSVDWFAENSWPARNNYSDKKNDRVTIGTSEDEDIPDWFTENSWPESKKGEKEDKVKDGEKNEEKNPERNNYTDKKTDHNESWLRETGWPVRHKMRNDVASQPFEDFDYRLCQQRELVHKQKDRTQSCCLIL